MDFIYRTFGPLLNWAGRKLSVEATHWVFVTLFRFWEGLREGPRTALAGRRLHEVGEFPAMWVLSSVLDGGRRSSDGERERPRPADASVACLGFGNDSRPAAMSTMGRGEAGTARAAS